MLLTWFIVTLLFVVPTLAYVLLRVFRLRALVRRARTALRSATNPQDYLLSVMPNDKFPLFVVLNVKTVSLAHEVMQTHREELLRWIPFIPKGSLFPSEGAEFTRHRQVMHAAMSADFTMLLNLSLQKSAEFFLEKLRHGASGEFVVESVFPVVLDAVKETILRLTFGTDADSDLINAAKTIGRDILPLVLRRMHWLAKVLPSRSAKQAAAWWKRVPEITDALVKKSMEIEKAGGERKPDSILQSLISARCRTNSDLTDAEIIGNAFGFGVGGNDSTASAVTALLYAMARHPTQQQLVRESLLAILKGGGSEELAEVEDREAVAAKSSMVRALIQEVVRLFPPFPGSLLRYSEHDVQLSGGMTVPKGLGVTIDIRGINQREDNFGSDAEIFRLERHLAGSNSDGKPRGESLSWGYGLRACIGRKLAEAIVGRWTVAVLTRYNVSIEDGPGIPFVSERGSTLQPSRPLRLKFTPL